MDKLIPFYEAIPRFGVKVQTGRNWLNQGKFPIPTYKCGKFRFVKESEMDAYFKGLVADSNSGTRSAIQQDQIEVTETGHFGLRPRKRGRPSKSAASEVAVNDSER